MLSLSDRTSDGIANRKAIANGSQTIAVSATASEAEVRTSLLGAEFASWRLVSDARDSDAMMSLRAGWSA